MSTIILTITTIIPTITTVSTITTIIIPTVGENGFSLSKCESAGVVKQTYVEKLKSGIYQKRREMSPSTNMGGLNPNNL